MGKRFDLSMVRDNVFRDLSNLKDLAHKQALKDVSARDLAELANSFGDLDYRAVDDQGRMRMIMSAISILAEFGIKAHFAGFNENGVPMIWVDADGGYLVAMGGDLIIDHNGITDASTLNGLRSADGGSYTLLGKIWYYGYGSFFPALYGIHTFHFDSNVDGLPRFYDNFEDGTLDAWVTSGSPSIGTDGAVEGTKYGTISASDTIAKTLDASIHGGDQFYFVTCLYRSSLDGGSLQLDFGGAAPIIHGYGGMQVNKWYRAHLVFQANADTTPTITFSKFGGGTIDIDDVRVEECFLPPVTFASNNTWGYVFGGLSAYGGLGVYGDLDVIGEIRKNGETVAIPNRLHWKYPFLKDEFTSGLGTTGNVGDLGWLLGAGTVTGLASSSMHNGVIRLSSTATSGTVGRIMLDPVSLIYSTWYDSVKRIQLIAKLNTGTTGKWWFGVCENPASTLMTGSAPARGSYFICYLDNLLYAETYDGLEDLQYNCAAPGRPAAGGFQNEWHLFEIVFDQSVPNVSFYFDQQLCTTFTSALNSGRSVVPFISIHTTNAVAKTIDIDYFSIEFEPSQLLRRWDI